MKDLALGFVEPLEVLLSSLHKTGVLICLFLTPKKKTQLPYSPAEDVFTQGKSRTSTSDKEAT